MQIPFLELPFFPKYYSLYVSVIVTDSPGDVASDGSIVKIIIIIYNDPYRNQGYQGTCKLEPMNLYCGP